MKKIVPILAVLLFASATMGGVTIDINDLGGGWAAVYYTTDANVSAFALTIEASGANINDVNGYFEGECTGASQGYGIFLDKIDGIDINDTNGQPEGWGSPIANASSPGASGTGLGTTSIIIEMCALYVDGNQPAQSGLLCNVQVTDTCTLSATEELTYRGGVVLEDTNHATVDVATSATDVAVVLGCSTFDVFCQAADICDDSFDPNAPDDDVDFVDYQYLAYYYGTTACGDDYCLAADICDDSFDYTAPDGDVDFVDYQYLAYYYGQTTCCDD